MDRLKDRVAVITGGNSGIGLATAHAFIKEGAKVVIFGRDRDTLDSAVNELGGSAIAVQGDVTNTSDLDALYETAKEAFGGVDVIFANAGIAEFSSVAEISDDHFDKVFNVNVKGAIKTVQRGSGVLNDGASIILTTSVSNEKGLAGMSVYAATKAAVRSLARTLSAELAERSIRVNAVSPGPVATPIYSRAGLSEQDIDGLGSKMAAQIPLKRFGEAREIADAVVFLASQESSYVVGTELVIDGGWTQL
ncbi:glucose 1-dehydrogenase [Leisingera sp. XS_AS12]|uniref:glucose 1-dehydrogenase n=1 Tax=Leisingera sp. XS_AS12 TaxID=3241294 RepID=UPI0035167942